MQKSLYKRKRFLEQHNKEASLFKEFILGGQDGLVNVLGIILGLAVATNDKRVVIIAGLAAAFAESVSMGAVAYTSTKAEADFYYGQLERENCEIKKQPAMEKREIYEIYYKKGFRGKFLNKIVDKITSNKKRWEDIMMKEELGLTNKFTNPIKSAIVVLLAALIGSFLPLICFFFFPIKIAIIASLIISAIALFITGATEAKLTVGNWLYKGIQLMLIGMAAALVGFLVGKISGSYS